MDLKSSWPNTKDPGARIWKVGTVKESNKRKRQRKREIGGFLSLEVILMIVNQGREDKNDTRGRPHALQQSKWSHCVLKTRCNVLKKENGKLPNDRYTE